MKLISRFRNALTYRMENWFGIIKLIFVTFVWKVFQPNLGKTNHWIICEKRNEARDNGYHFFKHLRQNHPEIDVYYVITKDSPDYHKVASLGKVITANSFKHCILFLSAKASVSSQPYGAYPFRLSLSSLRKVKRFCRPEQITVFLQHGIIKDDLSPTYNRYSRKIDMFVTSTEAEYISIANSTAYGFGKEIVKLTGLARFDKLQSMPSKIVFIAPSWRKYCLKDTDSGELIDNFK